MVTIRQRGEIVFPSESVELKVQIYGTDGNPVDPTSFPSISIIQPSGNVVLAPTSAGVYRLGVGEFGYTLTTTPAISQGVWIDRWSAMLPTGERVNKEFNFVILYTQLPLHESDGYESLGSDPGFHFNQTEIHNINKILKAVKARLKSSGMTRSLDQFGNITFRDCDIFSTDSLITFICQSLTMFNEIPHFTDFNFSNSNIIDRYFNVLVQGAVILALASQALIERGREYTINDQGISFQNPTISELLQTEWNTELTNHTEKVKQIKASMKPIPLVISSLTGSLLRNPQLNKLRFLRARQIF